MRETVGETEQNFHQNPAPQRKEERSYKERRTECEERFWVDGREDLIGKRRPLAGLLELWVLAGGPTTVRFFLQVPYRL